MKRVKNLASGLGGIAVLIGYAGIAEAVTGNGSFMAGAIIFACGLGACLWGIVR